MLGYSRSEAAEAIRKIGPAGKSLEEIVRLALKQLMKKVINQNDILICSEEGRRKLINGRNSTVKNLILKTGS